MATTVRWRQQGLVIAGVAAFGLSSVGLPGAAGADGWVSGQVTDCFGAPLLFGLAIQVPENSTGWTNGTSGDDVILGTDGPELINGMGGDDTICAGRGDDWIVGDSGDDMIKGEGGDDTIYGNDDEDFIIGDAGADEIHGGDHDDFLEGQRGDDELYGDDGADGLSAAGELTGEDDLDCGGDVLDTAIYDEDLDQVANCDILVPYDGPTEDGD